MQNQTFALKQLPTSEAFAKVIVTCKRLFSQKNQDYGSSWRIMRLPSITDQLFIKAKRIRTLQEIAEAKIEEGQAVEFIGIVNYCIMALIQLTLQDSTDLDVAYQTLSELYDQKIQENMTLLHNKNHDYGEAWREMRVSSITDIILMKLLRIKQIENTDGKPRFSEGVEGGYRDILNYAVFCLIHLNIGTDEDF